MKIGHIFFSFLLVFALNESVWAQTTNEMNVTVSNSATSNGTWSGGTTGPYTFTPSSATTAANVIYTDIQNRLLGTGLTAGNVTIVTAHTGGTQAGNVTFSQAITAATTSTTQLTFTVTAGGSITVSTAISLTPAAYTTGTNTGRPGMNVVLSANANVGITAAITASGGNGHGSGNGGNAGDISITGATGISLTANLTADGGTGNNSGSDGNYFINDGASAVAGVNSGQTGTSVIDGGSLTKTGAGEFLLSAAGAPTYAGLNTYSGTTYLNAGSLKFGCHGNGTAAGELGATDDSGLIVASGTSLDLGGWSEYNNEPITLNGNGGTTGGGALWNSGGADTYAGLVTLAGSSTIDGSGGTIAITNTGTITGSGFTLTLAGNQGGSVASIIGTGTGGVIKNDGGTWTLSGVNTYTGATTINNGILSVATIGNGGTAGNLGKAAATAGNLVLSGGTLQYTGATASTNRIITLTGATSSTIDVTANTLTISGAIPSSTGSLTKTDAGTLIISGANAYTGGTTISGGTLTLGASGVLANTGAVTLDGGTFNTGAAGYNETMDVLSITNNNSNITFGSTTNAHTLNFADSHLTTWGTGTITINNWVGSYNGTAGTKGQIFVGSSSAGLTTGQLSQIQFFDGTNDYPAVILSTGEVVPYTLAPTYLSYPTPNSFALSTAITPISPTTDALRGTYTVSPALPTGLSINLSTGIISGTPTVRGTGTYTVTVTNSGGSVSFPVVINVGTTYYARATGNWNTYTTWSLTSGGSSVGTGIWPVAGDNVIIGESTTSRTVTVPSAYSAACATLTMGNTTVNSTTGGTLVFTNSTSSLTTTGNVTMLRSSGTGTSTSTITLGAGTLSVTDGGNLDIASHTATSTSTTKTDVITISTGTLTVNGDLIFDAQVVQQSQIVFSGAGVMNLGGNFTLTNTAGTLTPATSTVNFNAPDILQTIPVGTTTNSSITYNNLYINSTGLGAILSATVTSTNVAGDTKVQSGSLDNGGFAIGGGTGNTFEVDNGATFFLSGTTSAFPTGFTTYTLGASSTVNYDGTGAQTVAAESYGNLTITQSGTRTVILASSGTIGIAGAFTPDVSTTSYTITGSTVNFNGTVAQAIPAFGYNNLTISGTYTTNNVTLASSGTIGVAGTFTPSATFTSGGYVNTGSTVDFNSTGSQTIPAFSYNNLINSGNGARTLASSGTIDVAGTFTPSTGTNTITGSTVDFNGTGAQTVPAFNFYNLNISGARTSNNVTLVNGGTIGVAGNFNANATFSSGSYVITGNTVNFNGTVAQNIGGTGLPTFNILNISNTTSPTSVTVNSNTGAAALNFTSSPTVLSIASSVTLTVSGTFTLNNSATAGVTGTVTGAGTLSVGAVAIGNNTTPTTAATNTTTLTSTVTTFTSSGNVTLNGYFVSGSPNKINNPVFDLQSGTLTVGGVITIINANGNNAATFTTLNGATSGFIVLQNAAPFSVTGGANTIALNGNNATVDYHGSALQSVLSGIYNSVDITNAANAELTGATTISGVLTFNSGNLVTNSQSLTLNGTVTGSTSSTGISGDASSSVSIGGSASMGTIYFASAGQQVANLTMNRTSTGNVIFGTNLTVSNTLTLTSGYITTGSNAVTISNAAASAIVAGGSNTTFTLGWINGNLNRSYTSGTDGTYTFPVGNSSAGHLASIATHSLVGTGSFSADFIPVHDGNNTQVDAFETGLPGTYKTAYTSMNPGGFWDITGFTPTGGNYDVQLYLNGLTGLVDNQFAELKRPIGSTTYADFKPDGGTLNGTSGLGRVVSNGYTLRMGLTSFSEFGIGQAATVLPIQLVSFTAQKAPNGTDVILNWNTASELDNDHFEVEVATQVTNDGLAFTTLGNVAGNGTSEIAHSYSFTDNQPDKSGVRYYRLKQVNTDGSYTYTDVVSVTFDAATLQSVNVYPNPVSNVLYYSFNAPQQDNLTITVTNLLGQPIYSQTQSVIQGSNTLQLNVNQLTQGIYLVNITNDNGLVSQRKIEKL